MNSSFSRFFRLIPFAFFPCFLFQPAVLSAQSEEKAQFVVTAYYSPKPNQSFYLRGSYEADLRLNGNGVAGASGKPVYIGMLAAPKAYEFGTKIHLDGLGIGSVDDRGGAIQRLKTESGSVDRIDVWMGEGEQGLRNALAWGKRKLTGHIVSEDAEVSLHQALSKGVREALSGPHEPVSPIVSAALAAYGSIFRPGISEKSSEEDVKKLQSAFKEMGYYSDSVDGVFSEPLRQSIMLFQFEQAIVTSDDLASAGVYGPKTASKLKEYYIRFKEEEARLTSASTPENQ